MTDHLTDPSTPEPSDADIDSYITSLDVVKDVPGVGALDNPREIFNWSSGTAEGITIQALPPETQQEIQSKLVGLSPEAREAAEKEMVEAELYSLARNHRVKVGLGGSAPRFHREMLEIENEQRLILQEAETIAAQLQEVDGYDHSVDEVTGEPIATPRPWIKGDQRLAVQNRYNQLNYRLQQLTRESEKRLQDALAQDRARIRELRELRMVHSEGEKLARKKNIEERIEAVAAAKAKRLSRTFS